MLDEICGGDGRMIEVIKAKAIELPQEEMIEFDGLDVYDAETGDNLDPSTVAERYYGVRGAVCADGFCLDWDGNLRLVTNGTDLENIPKEGRYLVQINGGKYMRW